MRNAFKILSCVAALLALAAVSHAKEWRGIVPLRSTREDVERLLGQCADPKTACVFSLDNEQVYIEFSGPDAHGPECLRLLPPGLVMQIHVNLTSKLMLSDLKLDLGALREAEVPDPVYVDDAGGVVYDTDDGKVVGILYLAEEKDRSLCPAYYRHPEMFVAKIISDPPTVMVSCPQTVAAGELLTMTVNIAGGDPEVTPTFSWEVTPDKLVSGQGDSLITVDTRGLEGRTIKATAGVGGYPIALEASCETHVIKKGKGDNKRARGNP
jgi:hypothetical protein